MARAKGNLRRRRLQWVIAPLVVLVIGLGWKYPWLGFVVPLAMALGFVGGFFRGRYVCGNLCPRGAFLDRMVSPASRRLTLPPAARRMPLRWVLFALLMAFMFYRVSLHPTSWEHWGRVFWLMCAVTTAIGLVFGLLVHPRSWCAVCPMGTLQNAVGGGKGQLLIDKALCRRCRACEKVCPIGIPLLKHLDAGVVADRDCLKCSECVAVCPVKALKWPGERPPVCPS